MPQINQYANTAASITNADWLDLDKNTGVGTFQSQKLRLSTLGAGLINVLPILGQMGFINVALNTTGIPITTSDDIVLKAVATGGTTDMTNAIFGGTITIQ